VSLRARSSFSCENGGSVEEGRGPERQGARHKRHRREAERGQHEAAAAEDADADRSAAATPQAHANRPGEVAYFLLSACRSISQLVWCRWCSGRASTAPRFGSWTTNSSSSTAINPNPGVTWRSSNAGEDKRHRTCDGNQNRVRLTRRAQCQSFARLLT